MHPSWLFFLCLKRHCNMTTGTIGNAGRNNGTMVKMVEKFSKCYNDLLAYVLQESHEEHYAESIPPLHLFLELGASSGTMINLMAMGISRTSSAQIVPHMISSKMNRQEIFEWLKYNNIYALGLPQSVLNELEQIM